MDYPRSGTDDGTDEEHDMTLTDAQGSHWGEIDGVSIDFPMVVDDMRQLETFVRTFVRFASLPK